MFLARIYQLDIKKCFLYGDLQKVVYLDQPPSYIVPNNEHLVCRLRKALYRLKQSPRAWFDRFSTILLAYGFKQSTSDHSVFVHQSSAGVIVLIVYVNDIIISSNDSIGIANLKHNLSQKFHTKNLGNFQNFLRIEVAHSFQSLFLSQQKYVLDLFFETGLLGA